MCRCAARMSLTSPLPPAACRYEQISSNYRKLRLELGSTGGSTSSTMEQGSSRPNTAALVGGLSTTSFGASGHNTYRSGAAAASPRSFGVSFGRTLGQQLGLALTKTTSLGAAVADAAGGARSQRGQGQPQQQEQQQELLKKGSGHSHQARQQSGRSSGSSRPASALQRVLNRNKNPSKLKWDVPNGEDARECGIYDDFGSSDSDEEFAAAKQQHLKEQATSRAPAAGALHDTQSIRVPSASVNARGSMSGLRSQALTAPAAPASPSPVVKQAWASTPASPASAAPSKPVAIAGHIVRSQQSRPASAGSFLLASTRR